MTFLFYPPLRNPPKNRKKFPLLPSPSPRLPTPKPLKKPHTVSLPSLHLPPQPPYFQHFRKKENIEKGKKKRTLLPICCLRTSSSLLQYQIPHKACPSSFSNFHIPLSFHPFDSYSLKTNRLHI